jgi:hypothetical protein
MTSPKTRARATPAKRPPSKRLDDDSLRSIVDEGIEKSLRVAIEVLDDDEATPHTKLLAARIFYAPLSKRLTTDAPDLSVTPQEKFLSLMREVRDVPTRELVVTDDDIADVPTDALPDFEGDAEPHASAS